MLLQKIHLKKTLLFGWVIFFFSIFFSDHIFCESPINLKSLRNFESLMEMQFFNEQFSKEDYEELNFFKSIYEKNYEKLYGEDVDINSIPKVIHFIWVGSKEFPQKSVKNVESWIKFHPDWKVKFWTDRDRPCPVDSMEKHFISELKMEHIGNCFNQTVNPGEQADLIRYEILYNEGGVYVDHDIECFQSFKRLTSRFDLYAFLEVPHNIGYTHVFFATNALIGCRPNHPILKRTMEIIDASWEEMTNKYSKPSMNLLRVLNRTFFPFTKGSKDKMTSNDYINILLPAAFIFVEKKEPKEIILKRIQANCCLANHKYNGAWR